MDFDRQVGVITGAASGIGRATATVLAERGADVAIADIDEDGLDAAATQIEAETKDSKVVPFPVDVSSASEVEDLFAGVDREFGRLDVVHNNAAKPHPPTPIEDLPVETWQDQMNVNLKGVFLGVRHAVPYLKEQGGGVIVNTGSISTVRPRPGASAYITTKGGIETLTRQLAFELADANIRVNGVAPVATKTNLLDQMKEFPGGGASDEELAEGIPLGRLAKPRDIGKAVAFLASDDASMITGEVLQIDGGRHL